MTADEVDRGARAWDMVVLWNESAGSWWWNAWREQTATEVSGLSPSVGGARHDMAQQIAEAEGMRSSTGPR